MRLIFVPFLLLTALPAFGQSQFTGMWQTKTRRATDKPAITVVIVELEKRLGGAVVLVNPDASETKLAILNLKITENVMEFDTHGSSLCFWSLTLQKNPNLALLHGGCPTEVVINEPVRKRPTNPN